MRRDVLLCLCLIASGCSLFEGSHEAPALRTHQPAAAADGTIMHQVTGQDVLDRPLLPQPGNIWADVLPSAQPGPLVATMAGGHGRVVAVASDTGLSHPAAPMVATRAVAPAVLVVTKAASPAGSRPMVQLAAAGSAQRAVAEWRRLRQRAPKLTDGHLPAVIEAEVNGQQVWRLRAAGFADVAEASAFCTGIRAVKADCWVVPPSLSP